MRVLPQMARRKPIILAVPMDTPDSVGMIKGRIGRRLVGVDEEQGGVLEMESGRGMKD